MNKYECCDCNCGYDVVSKTLNNLDMMLPLQDVVDCNFKLCSYQYSQCSFRNLLLCIINKNRIYFSIEFFLFVLFCLLNFFYFVFVLLFIDVFDPFSPTRSLSQVLNMMDQLMDNPYLSASRGIGAGGARRGWDARETEDALLLRVDMPGLGKEDVKISVEQNTLTIRGEEGGAKEGEDEEEGGARRYSSRIDLPDKLYKIDQIKAEMKNGVLKVVVPKMKEEERSDVINIKVE